MSKGISFKILPSKLIPVQQEAKETIRSFDRTNARQFSNKAVSASILNKVNYDVGPFHILTLFERKLRSHLVEDSNSVTFG